MKLVSWSRTDTGRRRDHNEDSLLNEGELGLFAVADGMGGHRGGATASRMAVELMLEEVKRSIDDLDAAAVRLHEELEFLREADLDLFEDETIELPIDDLIGAAKAVGAGGEGTPVPGETHAMHAGSVVMGIAARKASRAVYEASNNDPELKGMGTTLTAMLFANGRMHLAHAGDSRGYLIRDGTARQLTVDHTWIQEQVSAGILSKHEAVESRLKHIITRSIGVEPDIDVDVSSIAVEPGDCFVLCSDGMTNYIEIEELEKLVSATWYRRLAETLVDIANERGGEDNISVVVVYAANDKS